MAIITFSAVSGNFRAEIWHVNNDTFVTDIPLDTPFDTTPYAPEQPWHEAEYRIRTYPEGGVILAVENDPAQTDPMWNWEQQGEYYQNNWIVQSTAVFSVLVTVSGSQDIATQYGRVYWVDSGIISEFGDIPAKIPSEILGQAHDSTQYIVNLLNVPFKLPDELKGPSVNIVLGARDLEIPAPVIETDLIRVPLGEIIVNDLSDNSTDYVATEYDLFLPYLPDVIKLSPEWVVGKVITGEYVIDAYTGDVTVNIYNGLDIPIVTVQSSIGRAIPFRTYNTLSTEVGANQGVNNDVLSAYIRKSKQVLADGNFSNMVFDEGVVGNFSGYIQVENIDLETTATLGEQNQIKSILTNGVIIK